MSRSKPAVYAKMDPAHLFDGLFVPMNGVKREMCSDGVLRRPRLLVGMRDFGGIQVGFQGFEQLGADDQSLLLAIAYQLGTDGLLISSSPTQGKGPTSMDLWDRMGLKSENAPDKPIGAKKTTLHSLLIDAGYNPNKGTAKIKGSINRLRNAQIREKAAGWDRASNLISVVFKDSGETYVAANPRLTKAIFEGQHVKISLFERNQLTSEVSKILHAWLCSNIRQGKSLGNGSGVKIDTLLPHVWGRNALNDDRRRVSNKRAQLRDALAEIDAELNSLHMGYGWVVDQTSSGIVQVSRPKDLPMIEAGAAGYSAPSEVQSAQEADAERNWWDSEYRQESYFRMYNVKMPAEYTIRKCPPKRPKA